MIYQITHSCHMILPAEKHITWKKTTITFERWIKKTGRVLQWSVIKSKSKYSIDHYGATSLKLKHYGNELMVMKGAFTQYCLDLNKWICEIKENKRQKKKQTDRCRRTDLNISVLLVTGTFSFIALKLKELLAYLKAVFFSKTEVCLFMLSSDTLRSLQLSVG